MTRPSEAPSPNRGPRQPSSVLPDPGPRTSNAASEALCPKVPVEPIPVDGRPLRMTGVLETQLLQRAVALLEVTGAASRNHVRLSATTTVGVRVDMVPGQT